MKRDQIDTFEKLIAQLESLHSEMTMLAKKSANDALNAFKLKFVNSTLDQCNKFLGKKYRPFADFETFSEADLPSNSDVTFIISQYIQCAEKFRSDNIFKNYGDWYWKLDEDDEDDPSLPTAPPKKLAEK